MPQKIEFRFKNIGAVMVAVEALAEKEVPFEFKSGSAYIVLAKDISNLPKLTINNIRQLSFASRQWEDEDVV